MKSGWQPESWLPKPKTDPTVDLFGILVFSGILPFLARPLSSSQTEPFVTETHVSHPTHPLFPQVEQKTGRVRRSKQRPVCGGFCIVIPRNVPTRIRHLQRMEHKSNKTFKRHPSTISNTQPPPSERFYVRFAAPQRATSTQPVSRTPVGSDTHSTLPRRQQQHKQNTHPGTRAAPLSPPR
jgi:hypothetical protein